jgi:hypothetical protein
LLEVLLIIIVKLLDPFTRKRQTIEAEIKSLADQAIFNLAPFAMVWFRRNLCPTAGACSLLLQVQVTSRAINAAGSDRGERFFKDLFRCLHHMFYALDGNM